MASQYNGNPRPAEVLINGDKAELIRRGRRIQALCYRAEGPLQAVLVRVLNLKAKVCRKGLLWMIFRFTRL